LLVKWTRVSVFYLLYDEVLIRKRTRGIEIILRGVFLFVDSLLFKFINSVDVYYELGVKLEKDVVDRLYVILLLDEELEISISGVR